MNRQDNEQGVNPHATSSHLAANARRILEFVDGVLSATDTASIQQHLQTCPECQAFYQKTLQLNSALERGIKRPVLSPSFVAQLRERIATDESPQSQEAYLQRKHRIETEFEQYSVGLRRQLFGLPNLLDAISYGLAIMLGCYLLFAGFGWLTGMLATSWPSLEQHRMLLFSGLLVALSMLLAWNFAIRDRTNPLSEEV